MEKTKFGKKTFGFPLEEVQSLSLNSLVTDRVIRECGLLVTKVDIIYHDTWTDVKRKDGLYCAEIFCDVSYCIHHHGPV